MVSSAANLFAPWLFLVTVKASPTAVPAMAVRSQRVPYPAAWLGITVMEARRSSSRRRPQSV